MDNLEQHFLEDISGCQGIILHICKIYEDSEEDRNDLFQEILLQLWKSYGRFEQQSKFSTWVYRVGLNTAITYYKKRKRREEVIGDYLEYQDLSNDQVIENRDNLNWMYIAIKRLNQIEKAILLLYLEDKSYEEISSIVGISISNVGVKLNRIKSKLKKLANTQKIN